MLLILALIMSGLLTACKPEEPSQPADDGSTSDEPIPFRVSTMVRGEDKTYYQFLNDGLMQYFNSISDWSKNEQGSIALNFDININNIKHYVVDLAFSYTAEDGANNEFNALLTIKEGSDTYNVVIKDNNIYYMLDGYHAVESSVASLDTICNQLPLGNNTMGLGTVLAGVKADDTVYYGRCTSDGKTKVEYVSQVNFKGTMDTIDRQIKDAETENFAINFVNTCFSTTLSSLSKDDPDIDEQFPEMDVKLGYVGTVIHGSSIATAPEEVYITLKSPASTKSAFNGAEYDVDIVFKTVSKDATYQQTWQKENILDIIDNPANFADYSAEEMETSVTDSTMVTTITLLRNALNILATE